MVDNEEVKTQVHVFSEHKEEDAEEFSHRYDNIRIEMEYPFCGTVSTLMCKALFKMSLNIKYQYIITYRVLLQVCVW